jgi:hypothetical protein
MAALTIMELREEVAGWPGVAGPFGSRLLAVLDVCAESSSLSATAYVYQDHAQMDSADGLYVRCRDDLNALSAEGAS